MNFHNAKVVNWATVLRMAGNWLPLRADFRVFSRFWGQHLDGSTEIQFTAKRSTGAHFTTLRAN